MLDQISQDILRNLVDRKKLPVEKATEVLNMLTASDNVDIRKALVDEKLVGEEDYIESMAAVLGLSYVNLVDIQIPKEVLSIIPESTARGHSIIAYEQTADALKVAMADPNDRQIVEFLRKKVDMPVEVSLASSSGIKLALTRYQQSLEVEFENLVQDAEGVHTDGDLSRAAEDLPIIKITDTILRHAILQDASDIHIEPTEKNVIVRYRVDGILQDVLTLPKLVLAGLVARIKILSSLKIDEHRLPQDGRFKIEFDDYKVAFRVSTLPVFDGEKIVMRLLDESGHGLGLDDIGIRPGPLKALRNSISKPHGMVLVTGPTGSGKTTTLYAAMKELNTADVNISTVEDPIEYRMARINQTQVQAKIGLTFSSGLRALVRQDPDIIMVGEIRDEETAALAVNAALTGHLVLSTLHTNSAAGAVPRLIDMNVEPFLISSTTNVLLAQRLVRRLCQDCKKQGKITKEILESLAYVMDVDTVLSVMQKENVVPEATKWEDVPVFFPVGCKKCNNGYKGRLGIYEILEATPAIQQMIIAKATAGEIENKAKEEQQMITMLEDGMIKIATGMTTIEEVLRVAKE